MATRSLAVSKKANSAISKLAFGIRFKKFQSLEEVLRAMTDTSQKAQGNGAVAKGRKRVANAKFGNNPRKRQLPDSCKF